MADFNQIKSEAIACKLSDLAMLFDVASVVGILQLTLELPVDRVLSLETIDAANKADEGTLLQTLKTNFVTHAFNIATDHPSERPFLYNRVTRINS